MPGPDRGGRTDLRQRRAFQKLSQDPIGSLGIIAGNGIVFGPGPIISVLLDPVADNLLSVTGAGLNAQSPLTTKGDIWTWDSNNARLPVGADETVLVADSAQTLGLKYANRERVLYVNTADSATLTGAALGSNVFGAFSLTYTLPAGGTVAGTGLRITASFEGVGEALNATELRLKAGAQVLGTSGGQTSTAVVATKWTCIFNITCRSAGGSGSWDCDCIMFFRNGVTPVQIFRTQTTLDTGSSQVLGFDVAFFKTSTTSMKQTLFLVEQLN